MTGIAPRAAAVDPAPLPDRPAHVLLRTSVDDLDAFSWAESYARRRGLGVVVGSGDPVTGSGAADVVVVNSRTDEDRALALLVAASARCPVVAVPPGGTWRDDLPVLVGVRGDQPSEATLLSGFALARVLGAGLRAVCCTREPLTSTPTVRAAASVVDRCARRHPDVPVDTRVARSHPVTGLARHAGSASLLVLGCTSTTGSPTSRLLLDRCTRPVALIGPRVGSPGAADGTAVLPTA
ncbi:universal stress protein [Saccharothrix longispora]|uniref:universal stress protein n=1 Tax=Saccharothrix longispora TaxID=33920 RepID=UPI0028FD1B12|nr:universal stress protein [Saccharothrix longispora]MBY8850473.1 universal stress protein [Saccharothrix sp. MB29]MDU0292834.1 universal stress protein [Saccharothrix longispora]